MNLCVFKHRACSLSLCVRVCVSCGLVSPYKQLLELERQVVSPVGNVKVAYYENELQKGQRGRGVSLVLRMLLLVTAAV